MHGDLVALPTEGGDLLAEWRWLIGEEARLVGVTALGDALVTHPDGAVWLLDTCAGALERVAVSIDVLEQQPGTPDWLHADVVDQLRARVGALGGGQVFGFKVHPVLGGDAGDLENLEPTSTRLHFSLTGQLHEQVRGLEEGVVIEGVEGT